jgi:multiple sugar transport system permease protein
MRRTKVRSARDTIIGVVICAVMLFPLYWMVNVSLTRPEDLLRGTPNLFPVNPTFEGYSTSLVTQLPSLATSIMIGLGTAALALEPALSSSRCSWRS